MTTLFDNIAREFLGPSNSNELPYNYYNRSARKDVSVIRNTLEKWFAEIPDSDKKSMKSSFKKNFDDTFYELFLYNLFRSLGFKVEIHPILMNSSKKPDFLITKGRLEIYVEAKISKDKTAKEEALEKMKNEFYDSINKLKSDDFMLGIEELNFRSGKQPKTKKIVAELQKRLLELNPDVIEAKMKAHGFKSISIKYEDEDVYVIFNPIPVMPSARFDTDRRPIGIFPFETFWGGGEEAIRNSIDLKSKRYGKLDKPFLICINALGKRTTSRTDVDNAIWGSLSLSFSDDPNNRNEKWVRKRDGVFIDEKGPRKQNLSAVMVTQIYLHGIPDSKYWLYENPFAENKLDFQNLGLMYNFIENGYIKSINGNDLDKILNIDKDWLK